MHRIQRTALLPLVTVFLAGFAGSGPHDNSKGFLLFDVCSTCVQPCSEVVPFSHETIGSSGNRAGPPQGCFLWCDCSCHSYCGGFASAERQAIDRVFIAAQAEAADDLRRSLSTVRGLASIDRTRGLLQFEGCEGIVGAQLPLSEGLLRVAREVLEART